jgi:DNA repair protein RecO (recombination protein O)
MNYKTYTGIVLKRQPWREADEVMTFWSWEEGKVRLLVRAVRKSASRLKGALSPLSWLRLSVISSEYFPVVISAQVTSSYSHLTDGLPGLAAVFNLFEMVLRATPDRQPNSEISLILRRNLDYLEAGNEASEDYFNAFRLHLLSALGYRLTLDDCANCHRKPLSGDQLGYFSNMAFGALCPDCARVAADAEKLERRVCEYLLALEKPSSKLATLGVEAKTKASSSKLLTDFFRFVTERPLNSQKFLDQALSAKI